MALVSNAPVEHTRLRAEARKSFSFAVWIKDELGRTLDITGTTMTLVARERAPQSGTDVGNLIANEFATYLLPESGYARFDLQASDLDLKSGEYPFAIVLDDEGYSSVLAKGTLTIEENSETASVGGTYVGGLPSTTLQILLRGRSAISVQTGAVLPPGVVAFTEAYEARLLSIEEGAQVNVSADWEATGDMPGFIQRKPALGSAAFVDVESISLPPGGSPGEVLTKISASNFDAFWRQPTGGGGGGGAGLDPTGVLAGLVPMADGADHWSWEEAGKVKSVNSLLGEVVLNLGNIPDEPTDPVVPNVARRVAITAEARDKLDLLQLPLPWADLSDVPLFGTAALKDEEDFLTPEGVDGLDITTGEVDRERLPAVAELRGFSSGTEVPTGGMPGDIYFQIV